MILRAVSFAVAFSLFAFSGAISANGQEISQEHRESARAAIAATRATDPFDAILLNAASSVKDQLISSDPDKATEISRTVDEEALALAPRRSDLEQQAVQLFASTFTKEELDQITMFYASETGKKYLDNTPILARELSKAARIWANGINRDLTDNVTKKMFAAKDQ